MSGDLNVNFSADATALIKDQARLIKQQDDLIQKYKKMGQEAKKTGGDAAKYTAAAAKELERFAAHTKQINRTPLEKYADEMRKLNLALKAGKLDQETFNRAVRAAKTEFDTASTAARKTFGSGALASLNQYAVGLGSLATVVGIFRGAMQQAKAETEGAMNAVNALVESRKRLNQVGTSVADIDTQNVLADRLAEQYGVPRDQAKTLLFSARSEQFSGSEDTIMRLAAANVLDLPSSIQSAGTVRGIFDKKITPEQAIVATLVGAETSKLSAEQFAAEMPKIASMAKEIGATPEEAMATLSVIATQSPRAAEYASTLFGTILQHEDLADKGIVGSVQALQAMPKEERAAVLGTSKEVVAAYGWISRAAADIPQVQAAIAGQIADPEAFIARKEHEGLYSGSREANLRLAQVGFNRAQIAQEISRERRLAETGFARGTTRIQAQTAMEEQGVMGPMGRYVGGKIMEQAEHMRAVPQAAIEPSGYLSLLTGPGLMEAVVNVTAGSAQQLYQNLTGASKDLSAAAQAQQQAADAMQQSAPNYTNAARANAASVGGAVEAR